MHGHGNARVLFIALPVVEHSADDRQTGSEKPAAEVDCRQLGYALPPSADPRRILILIDAALSS